MQSVKHGGLGGVHDRTAADRDDAIEVAIGDKRGATHDAGVVGFYRNLVKHSAIEPALAQRIHYRRKVSAVADQRVGKHGHPTHAKP